MPGRKTNKSPKLKGQGRKGRSSSKGPKSKKKKSGSKSRSASPLSPGKTDVEIDILSPAAMYNAYYICHHAPDCLEKRGFAWPGGKGGGKKGKKGKKKKKKK